MILNVKNFFFGIGLIMIGASTWISLERFEVVPPMCIVGSELYDMSTKRK